MTSSGSSRRRLACAECTRRKVKCDKEIPCNNCIKKGIQDACTRETDISTPSPRQLSQAATALPDIQYGTVLRAPVERELDNGGAALVEMLSRRVTELESVIHSGSRTQRGDSPSKSSTEIQGIQPLAAVPSTSMSVATTANASQPIDSEIEDAATILEFLAWGRMKNPNYHADISSQTSNVADSRPSLVSEMGIKDSEMPPLQLLQLHLPNRRQVFQLVDWHIECLLWYHGSFYAPIFRRQLQEFYDRHNGYIESKGLSLQWVALLFSILAGTMTCAGNTAQTWGFRDSEQETLSSRWLQGTITCLNRADYMAHHSLDSVEAIATLTISAHLLGYSNQQSVLLASAVKISQSLGLHRLGIEPSDNLTERDLRGRRAWCQLLQPLHCNTEKPRNRLDDNLMIVPESVPTILSYARYLLDVAYIMPQLQDAVMSSNTLYTKYEQVLKYDKQMRALATAHRPYFLSNVPIDPSWPQYIPWARRALAISYAHKICMIHRAFLGLSFTNSAFSFTRRTCIAAAKTILKEQKQATEENSPSLWIYHAFSVAACIILCLDIFHRKSTEPEYSEHRGLVEEGIAMLQPITKSAIARRGVRLLCELLEAVDRSQTERRKRRAGESSPSGSSPSRSKKRRFLDMPAFVRTFCDGNSQASPAEGASDSSTSYPTVQNENSMIANELFEGGDSSSNTGQSRFPHSSVGQGGNFFSREELFADFLPQVPFDGASTFENLLFLARGYDE